MNFISEIPIIGNLTVTIVAFVFVIGVIVFVHEYGHYIVGRWRGIHAETFSLGFGPVIWSRTDKRGTRWQLAVIPLGGYVKFLGDRNAASFADDDAVNAMNAYDRRRSFPAASVFSRSLTVLAGPIANFILSIALFTGLIMWQGFAIEHPTFGKITDLPAEIGVQEGDKIIEVNGVEVFDFQTLYAGVDATDSAGQMAITVLRDDQPMQFEIPNFRSAYISSVTPLSPGSKAGVLAGDFVLKIDDQVMSSFAELAQYVVAAGETEILLTLWRAGDEIVIPVTPQITETINADGTVSKKPMVGISGGDYFQPATETPAIWDAVWFGAERTYSTITQTFDVLGLIIEGAISPTTLQGPVGIAQVSGAVVKTDVFTFITLIAIISTSIGLLNLFPIPILDGGHLVTYIYEAVRGRPPSPAFLNVFMSIGLAMVMLLMVFTFYNDIMRL